MNQGILKEDYLEKQSTPHDCSGTARCITGIVTKVIDGDTIKVDGQSIRFALASAPELNEFQGPEARNFIDEICPVGSTATVDEDDGQTEGSYGRIVGVIYCNYYRFHFNHCFVYYLEAKNLNYLLSNQLSNL